jgi:hypothetical protein
MVDVSGWGRLLYEGDGSYGGGGGSSEERVGDEAPGTRATGSSDGNGGTLSCNGERSGGVEQLVNYWRGGRRRELSAAGRR